MIAAVFLAVFSATLFAVPSSALGLKVAPLDYKATLKKDEVKKGFIDVSNPTTEAVRVRVSVQAFKQINDDGALQFYDDEQVANGIKTDLTNFDLGPREAVRMVFSIDGRSLPEGDVFAAVFFTSEPKQETTGLGQQVRVGTIISVINGTPGSRKAEITGLRVPFFQLGKTLSGSYSIKNTGPANSGFFPTVKVSAWPSGATRNIESSLVFGGRQRSNDFSLDSGVGIYRLEASFGSTAKSTWTVVVAPWMVILATLVTLVVGTELLLFKRRRKKNKKTTSKKPASTPDK